MDHLHQLIDNESMLATLEPLLKGHNTLFIQARQLRKRLQSQINDILDEASKQINFKPRLLNVLQRAQPDDLNAAFS
jgi:hypothetical protein